MLIAFFKLLKAAGLALGGLATLQMLRPDGAARVREWLSQAGMHMEHQLLARVLTPILRLQPRKLEALAIALFLYAALFLVEGAGLMLQRRWAEYLTVFATASLIPFEVWEVAHRASLPRIGVLILNLAAVGYLWWKLKGRGSDSATDRRPVR